MAERKGKGKELMYLIPYISGSVTEVIYFYLPTYLPTYLFPKHNFHTKIADM